ncbi:MAG: hypothetical protein ABSF56_02400 [Minisyncoccia bacterium]|jgi:hypothetical protein
MNKKRKWLTVLIGFGSLIVLYFLANPPTLHGSGPRAGDDGSRGRTSYTKTFWVREMPDHPWVYVEIKDGWTMTDDWGSAPVDLRVYRGTDRSLPPTEYILPRPYQDRGKGIWKKGYRLNREKTGYAEVTCTFKKDDT